MNCSSLISKTLVLKQKSREKADSHKLYYILGESYIREKSSDFMHFTAFVSLFDCILYFTYLYKEYFFNEYKFFLISIKSSEICFLTKLNFFLIFFSFRVKLLFFIYCENKMIKIYIVCRTDTLEQWRE